MSTVTEHTYITSNDKILDGEPKGPVAASPTDWLVAAVKTVDGSTAVGVWDMKTGQPVCRRRRAASAAADSLLIAR